MILYITLFTAVGFEVAGTMLLPLTHNFSKPLPSTLLLLFYGCSFYLLALVTGKLPLLYICFMGRSKRIFSSDIKHIYKQAPTGNL